MKSILSRLACFGALMLTLPGRSLNAQVVADSVAPPADTKVEIRVNGRAVREATVQSGQVSMDTLRLKVRTGDDLKALLKEHRIVPDAAAIALFYELNPGIRDADALTVGSSVMLPALKAQDSGATARRGRVTYAVLADTTYKAELIEKAKRITQLTDSLRLVSNRPVWARTIDANADRIAGAVHTLADASIPLSQEAAAEFSHTLVTYQLRIQDALKMAEPAQENLFRTGTHVAAEATAIAAASRTGTNSRVELGVDVIDTNGQRLGNVRIVYVRPMYEHFPGERESFIKSDPVRVTNPMDLGPWIIWVEDLTGKEVSVRRELITVTNPGRPVTLVVKPGG